MTDEYFTTEAQLSNRQRHVDFAPSLTFSPVNTTQFHTRNSPSLAMVVVFMLAGFAVGHIVRRGRELIHREYWRVMSSYIAQMVMATTKHQGQ